MAEIELKMLIFGDVSYKTNLIWFLVLLKARKIGSKLGLEVVTLNKAQDLAVNTVTESDIF